MDEEGTHAQLQDHLRLLVDPKIAEYRGRVVKNTGDGMLAPWLGTNEIKHDGFRLIAMRGAAAQTG
jgi:class 3 adenylate cyclase